MAQVLSMISIEGRTPLPGILLEAIIALFLIAIGSFDTLVYGLSFAGWIFYGSAVMAVPILRYRLPDRPRPYKVRRQVNILAVRNVLYFVYKLPLNSAIYILCSMPFYNTFHSIQATGVHHLQDMKKSTYSYYKFTLLD